MITVAITFIMFLLMYRTFFTAYTIADGVTNHLDQAEIKFALFRQFSREASAIIRESDIFEGNYDSLTFLYETGNEPYPVKTTYRVRRSSTDLVDLWQSRESLIYTKSYAFPALTGAEEITFSYFDGKAWSDAWNGDDFPAGIALRIVMNGREYFLPVKTGDINEEEKE